MALMKKLGQSLCLHTKPKRPSIMVDKIKYISMFMLILTQQSYAEENKKSDYCNKCNNNSQIDANSTTTEKHIANGFCCRLHRLRCIQTRTTQLLKAMRYSDTIYWASCFESALSTHSTVLLLYSTQISYIPSPRCHSCNLFPIVFAHSHTTRYIFHVFGLGDN
jgi:hypothetical protein